MAHRDSDKFSSISPAEFFYRNRQMAGFGNPTQALFSTVRELVENSLDACEEISVAPLVHITISRIDIGIYRVMVSDNGIGIPAANVPESFGRVLYGSKYDIRQRRGTFGLGVTMAVLYGQMTTNRPTRIHTQQGLSGGRSFKVFIDIESNRPVVDESIALDRPTSGTTVSIDLKADLRRSKERIIDYIKLTSIGSPHAKLVLQIEDDPPLTVGPWVNKLPRPPSSVLPHPRAADVEFLKRLVMRSSDLTLNEFLIRSFQQVGIRTAGRILRFIGLDPRRLAHSLTRDELVTLSSTLRNFDGFTRPDSACLSPIGKDHFIAALNGLVTPQQIVYSTKGPLEWSGNPFIIEGALIIASTHRSANDVPDLVRFANRVPLLYDAGDDLLTKVLKQVSWNRYGIFDLGPPILFIHLCSTRIPYRAAGKQSIAHIPEIEVATLALFRELGRKMGRHSRKHRLASRDLRKRREFERMFQLVVRFGAELAECTPPSIDPLVRSLFEVNDDE
ncbi:MAG: DNA topoisomerase VI subunit B [Candidatus Thorarchaeota archaeon]|nr:DNA topoisomerase VI subunit B [Candidatus Thorarchaeota archaeon]